MMNELNNITDRLIMINRLIDCSNGKHKFEPYKKGTVKCSICGKFAKIGYLTHKGGNE